MEAVFPPEDHSSAHVQTTSWFLLSAAGFTSLSFVLKGILALLIMVFMTHMAEEKLEKGQKKNRHKSRSTLFTGTYRIPVMKQRDTLNTCL